MTSIRNIFKEHSPNATNIKNCSAFSILVKIANRDIAIDSLRGKISVTEKVVLKTEMTIIES